MPQALAFSKHWILLVLPVPGRLVGRLPLSIALADDPPVLCCFKDAFLAFVLDVDVAHEDLLSCSERTSVRRSDAPPGTHA